MPTLDKWLILLKINTWVFEVTDEDAVEAGWFHGIRCFNCSSNSLLKLGAVVFSSDGTSSSTNPVMWAVERPPTKIV